MNTTSSFTGPRRYTITRLLRIAKEAQLQGFDLSKFTYDAARAGVVPPLGDCAMRRRTASGRPRGWSTESTETLDDVVVFQGNIPRPSRQPSNPPGGPQAQKDEGFARFLKKHASPTHNRVTTGGRIVPMEKRGSPPKFGLPHSADSMQQAPKEVVRSMEQDVQRPVALPAHAQTHAEERAPSASPTFPVEALAAGEPYGQFRANADPIITDPARFPNPAFSTPFVPQSNHYMTPTADQYIPQASMGYGPPAGPLVPPIWPQQTWTAPLMAESTKSATLSAPGFPWVPSQQLLDQAEELFRNLDLQLKAIDRHRAVNSHNASIAAQRMTVVQQRADIKESIHRLRAQVAYEQSLYRPQLPMSFLPVQNPYSQTCPVPKSQPSQFPTSSPDHTVNNQSPSPRQPDKSHSVPKRKPIPIIPPPDLSPARIISIKDVTSDQESAHSQTASPVTAHMVERTPQKRFRNNRQVTSLSQTSSPSITSQHRRNQQIQYTSSGWVDREGGRNAEIFRGYLTTNHPPATLVAPKNWELQMDGLRLPVGVIVKIRGPDGYVTELRGQDLQRPSSVDLRDWEVEYWARKPRYTQEMLENLSSQAEILGLSEDGRSALLDLAGSSEGLSHQESITVGKDFPENRIERFIQDQSQLLVKQHTATSKPGLVERRYNTSNVASVTRESSFDAGGKNSAGDNVSGQLSRADNSHIEDEMDNKGYSSVSVSSVHVTASLPPSFDGAIDPRRRNAKTMLSAASKTKSPPLLQQVRGGGSA